MENQQIDNLPTSAAGVLDLFATSRTGIDVFSDQLIQGVKEGEINPLKVRVWSKTMETIIERVLKETTENQMTEANKYPGTKFEFSGAEITKADTYTKYDYSACKDPEYNRMLAILEAAKKQLEEREAFLKAIKEPLTILDEGTGEYYTINGPNVKRTPGLKVSIK